jgi:hypothetical protein
MDGTLETKLKRCLEIYVKAWKKNIIDLQTENEIIRDVKGTIASDTNYLDKVLWNGIGARKKQQD